MDATEQNGPRSQKKMTYIFVLIIVAVFVLLFWLFLPLTSVHIPKETRCGDGVCDEDCFTCPADCSCKQGSVCYNDLKKCGKIPSDVTSLLDRTYGKGNYRVIGSWTEDGERVFHATAGGKGILIKNRDITEMEPL